MCIITGAVKTSSILPMQLLTNLTSMKHDIHRDSEVLLQKLCKFQIMITGEITFIIVVDV